MASNKEDISLVQLYLKSFFNYFATFSCDKAKEHVEKAKMQLLPNSLQVALVTLAQNEKMYYSLAFMEQKSWFGRKELLRNSYQSLKNAFVNIQTPERSDNIEKVDDVSTIISSLCFQLSDFCSLRVSCIGVYNQISKCLAIGMYENVVSDIENLIKSHSGNISHHFLQPLQMNFLDEVNTLASLFRASHAISNWKYVEAMISIQEVAVLLSKWKPLLAKNQGSSSFRSGFFGFGDKSNPNPTCALCDWMEKFFNFLVAKFTFYFYKGLSANATPEETKSALGRTSYDFVSKATNFMKKNDAKKLFLCFDTRESQIVPQHGYTFADNSSSSSTNTPLEDFMIVLSLPQSNVEDSASIQSLLSQKDVAFQLDKIEYSLSDDKKSCSFAARIEPKLYMVLAFNGVKNEKDGSVSAFLNEILQQLKTKRLGLLLKPGGK